MKEDILGLWSLIYCLCGTAMIVSSATTGTSKDITTTTTTLSPAAITSRTTPSPPQLGEACDSAKKCVVVNSECQGDKCQCKDGSFTYGSACVLVQNLKPRNVEFSNNSCYETESLQIKWTVPIAVNDNSVPVNYTVTCISSNGTEGIVQDLTNQSGRCVELIPGYRYNVIVAASYNTYSNNETVVGHTKPGKPGALQQPGNGYQAPDITLSWEPSEGGVDNYTVNVVGGRQYVAMTPSHAVQVSGLDHGKIYSVQITANSGPCSNDIRHTFRTVTTRPERPDNSFVQINLAQTEVSFRWSAPDKPNGDLKGYVVCTSEQIYNDTDWETKNPCVFESVAQHTARGLIPGAFYKFDVYTTNDMYNSSEAAVFIVRTKLAASGKISNLNIDIGSNYITLTWNRPERPGGDILLYNISVKGDSPSEGNCTHYQYLTVDEGMVNNSSSFPRNKDDCSNSASLYLMERNQRNMSAEFSGLQADTNYTLVVYAGNVHSSIGQAETKTVRTKIGKPGDVRNVVGDNINSTSVTVKWTPPTGNPGHVTYYVNVTDVIEPSRLVKGCTVEVTSDKGYTEEQCTVTGLEEFWQYNFSVMAKTEADNSSWVSSDTVTTLPGIPGAVENIGVQLYDGTDNEVCDARKVRLTWMEPSLRNRNGKIVRYVVENRHQLNQTVTVLEIDDPDPFHPGRMNRSGELENITAESSYTWMIWAVLDNNVTGIKTNKMIHTGTCPPPAWSNADQGHLINKPTREIRTSSTFGITLQKKFFTNTEQGQIIKQGLIISPTKDTALRWSSVRKTTWMDASAEGFKHAYFINLQPSDIQSGSTLIIGGGDCQKHMQVACNGELEANFRFYVSAFACTLGDKCTLSPFYGPFTTAAVSPQDDDSSDSAGIVVSVVMVILSAVAITIALLWYKNIISFDKCTRGQATPVPVTSLAVIPRKRPVRISLLEATLADLHRDSNLRFSSQYEDIQKLSPKHPQEAANEERNKPKNRWVNILPFDHSRVKLQRLDDDDGTSDYINANYIPGFSHQREYIATQGPLPGTVDDFWRMIWEHNVCVIVMLTQCKEGNRVKCEMYWPSELHEPKQYGDVIVNPISISPLDKYNITIFDVTVNNQTRKVHHFHYLDFPDFSANVEFSSFVDFVELVRQHTPRDMVGPMVVHCSAGVGRTGTFVAIDRLYQFLYSPAYSEKASVDIFDIVMSMRENRVLMVQTESQYVMIHDCLIMMIERKKHALEETSDEEEDDNLYVNQAFESYPEILYENASASKKTELGQLEVEA